MIYKNLFIIFILIFEKICIIYSEPVILKLIVNAIYDNEGSGHRKLVNEFNNVYSIVHNIPAKVDVVPITPENSSPDIKSYGDTFSSTLKRGSQKYDLVHFYSAYSKTYGDYFEDLSPYLAEEFKDYDEDMLKKACTNNDGKIVGLPYTLLMNVLYSNKDLLKRHGKRIPKSWDELIETANYIYEEELKNGMPISRYVSALNDPTSGTLTLHEFINSFRESNKSPVPSLRSKAALEALEKLKAMKDEFGEEDFLTESFYNKFFMPTTLFMSFSYISHDPDGFVASILPGRKENVTGTIINTTNFGINKHISDKSKKYAAEFLKFAASKDIQKRFILQDQFLGGNMKLYDDKEVCSIVECEIMNDNKPYLFMDNDPRLFGSDEYFPKYQGLLDYIFGDKTAKEVLQRLDDVTRIYTFSLDTDDTVAGLIIFIIFIGLLTIIALSVLFVFIDKLKNKFRFLSKNLWIITTLGSLILLSSIITLYDDVSNAKCHLRITLINTGFILSICPSLHKLIANFPERNEISSSFKINKYITIIVIMLFTIGINEIYAISTYKIEEMMPEEGKHFHKCVMNNSFGNVIYFIIQFFNFFMILVSLVLIFMEWNLKETSLDVKYLATALFMDTLSLILLIIFDKISINDYIVYNVILAVNIMLFAVSNHIFIYFVRVLPIFRPDDSLEDSRRILGKVSSSNLHGSNKPTITSPSYNNTYNKNTMAFYSNLEDSPFSNSGTSFYNNETTATSSPNHNSNNTYNYPSNVNMNPTNTNSSSGSSNIKMGGGLTQKIMNYHNQTNIN